VPSDTVHIGPPTLLGVGVATGDQDPDVPGVIIREALRGGPADQAGLVDGDILTSINGQRLNSATELTRILDRYYPGDVIDLTWIDRTGQQRFGKATLVAGP
jgi:S1-C subfamily serine protease